MAGTTGLEPATSAVTGQRSNQLNYVPGLNRNRLIKDGKQNFSFTMIARNFDGGKDGASADGVAFNLISCSAAIPP